MELTMMQMYWLTRLDSIKGLSNTLAFVCGVLIVLACMIYFLSCVEPTTDLELKLRSKVLWSIPLSLVGLLLCITIKTFTPTTKQMAAIIVVPKIVNNHEVQEMPDKLLGLANKWINELRPNKEEKK